MKFLMFLQAFSSSFSFFNFKKLVKLSFSCFIQSNNILFLESTYLIIIIFHLNIAWCLLFIQLQSFHLESLLSTIILLISLDPLAKGNIKFSRKLFQHLLLLICCKLSRNNKLFLLFKNFFVQNQELFGIFTFFYLCFLTKLIFLRFV
jgi:hypothetical protein